MDDLQRVTEFLRGVGFPVTGITFDLDFNQTDGLAGIGLLADGRQVRFWIPNDKALHPAINVLQKEARV